MTRQIRRLVYGLTLRKKMVLTHFSLVLVTVFLFATYATVKTSEALRANNDFAVTQSFRQTGDYLGFRLDNLTETCNELILNSTLNGMLNPENAGYSRMEQFSNLTTLRQILHGMERQQDIYRIHIYIDDGLIYSNDGGTIHGMTMARSAPWWDALMQLRGKFLFVTDWAQVSTPNADEPLISMLRTMYQRTDYTLPAFIVQIDIRRSELEKTLRTADFSEGSVTYLVDENGRTIASSSWEKQAAMKLDTAQQPALAAQNTPEQIVWRQEKFVALQTTLAGTGWRMMTMIPHDDYYSAVDSMRARIIQLSAVVLMLGYALAYFTAGSHVKRIYKLCDHMRGDQGGLQHIPTDQYQDELSVLYSDYNRMVDQTKRLLEENYEIGQELKNMEYRAMQSQINPHFLYNTLDTISWLSYNGRTEEVGTVVNALARFYRLSLNGGRDVVTVQDELRHVDYYMRIQRVRMENRAALVCRVPEEMGEYVIPKITLQPIVENALLHGILEKPDKTGTITIDAQEDGDAFLLKIADDGVGFDRSACPEMASLPQQDSSRVAAGSHYGLMNIDRRIKLLYGDAYGLRIDSRPGEGTTVTIRLPKKRMDEMENTPPIA